MPENSKAGSKVFQVEAHDPDDPNTAEVKKNKVVQGLGGGIFGVFLLSFPQNKRKICLVSLSLYIF